MFVQIRVIQILTQVIKTVLGVAATANTGRGSKVASRNDLFSRSRKYVRQQQLTVIVVKMPNDQNNELMSKTQDLLLGYY